MFINYCYRHVLIAQVYKTSFSYFGRLVFTLNVKLLYPQKEQLFYSNTC